MIEGEVRREAVMKQGGTGSIMQRSVSRQRLERVMTGTIGMDQVCGGGVEVNTARVAQSLRRVRVRKAKRGVMRALTVGCPHWVERLIESVEMRKRNRPRRVVMVVLAGGTGVLFPLSLGKMYHGVDLRADRKVP